MRTRGIVAALLVAGLATSAAAGVLTGPTATAAPDTGYTWRNVEIVGGGFVPGIVYSRVEPGLVYARTDIGGAYRLDTATGRWRPLLDHVGWDAWGHTGVLSLAADPVDADRVYVAVGSYTNDWDPNNGAVLRSDDRGETWTKADLPFKVGGNMPGRGMGERLAVDPNDNDVLYLGAESGNGLWRSTDAGRTWSHVTSMPNAGTYVAQPGDAYNGDVQGVVWVVFDPDSGRPGSPSRTIYVGVADPDHPVYRSTDAGATWEVLPGVPTGYIPHKAVLDEQNDRLYLATSNTGGPYDGSAGQVLRLDTGTGTWTDISPVALGTSDAYFGYSGLTIDRQDPDTIMVATQISWWPDVQFFRSTNGGQSWTRAWDWAGYPDRDLHYTQDISAAPWLTFANEPQLPEVTPKLGWMTESLEIDPFDSDRAMYGTGATIYGIDDLTAWDRGGTVAISVAAQGLEETSVQDLAAPPGDVELFSALGDIGGFRHDDITKVPDMMFTSPVHVTTTSLDFAQFDPDTVVRVGKGADGVAHIGVSTNGGRSWWAGQDVQGVNEGGTVAVSADGTTILWSPDGGRVQWSGSLGSSWTPSSGVPTGARVEADRESWGTFYAFADGSFYTSRDYGRTFYKTAASGLPAKGNVRFAGVPGHNGHVWLAGGTEGGTYGLWMSSDHGATFRRVAGVEEADTVGFGKAAPGRSYPAVYISGQVDGVRGIFRSDDIGQTWTRINDDEHQWGWTGAAITGDPDVYGRVYVATNGRGVIVGDLTGTVPTHEPTTEPTDEPTDEPTTEPTEEPTEEPTTEPTEEPTTEPTEEPTDPTDASCVVRTVVNSWPGGQTTAVHLTNASDRARSGWTLRFDVPAGQQVTNYWSAEISQTGSRVVATPAAWNGTIPAGASIEFGFLATNTAQAGAPTQVTLDGEECAVVD